MKTLMNVGLLLLIAHLTFSQQTDSSRINYSQETHSFPAKHESRHIRAVYRRFIRAQIEEKTLIKIGAVPMSISQNANGEFGWGFRSEVAVEQKITSAISLLVSVRTAYRQIDASSDEATIDGLVASRWYYNMNRRINLGKSANNFSDQYLTVLINQPLWTRANYHDPRYVTVNGITFAWGGVGFGLQRRLSKLGYLDANVATGYALNSPNPFLLRTSFLIGFGL